MTAGDPSSDSLLVWNGVVARVPAVAEPAAHETFENSDEALQKQNSREGASSSSEALPGSHGARDASSHDSVANPL